ncbi:MAG: class II glutamine amidotransferase [Desulfuromonadales bacterium]|jgi:predicted glutamine amidotransferase
MCRVLGITQFEVHKHRELVTRFSGLVKTGVVMAEDPPGHADGWGLAFYREGQLVVHKSGRSLLDEFETVIGLLSELQTTPLMILHLRKSAWQNTSNTRHAHPFYRDQTVFFHNGVVYDYPALLPEITIPGLAEDARDTEVFFYHVLSQQAPDLGQAFLASAASIRRRFRFSALNSLFSDGETFYAYREYAREPDYYSLFKAGRDDSLLIASEPLDDRCDWVPMTQGEFLSVDFG